jgi:fucose permease
MNNINILQEVTSKRTTNEQHKHLTRSNIKTHHQLLVGCLCCLLVVGFDVTSCKMFVLFIGGGF